MQLMMFNLYNNQEGFGMKAQGILILFLATLLSGGCSPSQAITPEPQVFPLVTTEEAVPIQQLQSTLVFTPQGDNSPMTPSAPGLQGLIEKAKADLVQRLSISITKISLLEATEVIWPDSSLGCSQTGMASAQVLTPGYLILLGYNNNKYEYHANKGTYVTYCLNPAPPILGAPNR